ncbi:adenine-specific methyltransferase [Paramecium bursaria Chlorella virus NE-JV-1]|nr:adenine-specific methyltransferase [Paramecium bursaria Chlorella virus NE-JV-1]
MKPFLKWVGGKQQIVDNLLKIFPKEIDTYHEPFLGGGSVLLALLESDVIAKEIRVNDLNPYLIQTFVDVRDDVDGLVDELNKLCNDKAFYYESRNRFNELKKNGVKNTETSALFIFLNKTGFRGLHREGPHGFNVPFGHYKNPRFFNESALRKCSELIKNVKFSSVSYEEFLKNVQETDFVYLDPPYAPETSTSFTKYNAQDFLDHDSFFRVVKSLPRFLMSNSRATTIVDSFPEDEYDVRVISCRRSINSKNPGATADEVLISNFLA